MKRNPTTAKLTAGRTSDALTSSGDRIGVVGSVLCAAHCALLPVVLAALPALGLGGASLVDLDQAFTVFATLLGVTMLSYGFRRHRVFRAWMVLIPGLALIWIGSFTPLHNHSMGHVVVMVAGGLAVAAAHLINLRLSHAAVAPRALIVDVARSA